MLFPQDLMICTPIVSITLKLSFNSIYNDTPLQYSCLENPMDGGAW